MVSIRIGTCGVKMINTRVCEDCWWVFSKGNKNTGMLKDWWYCAPYAYRMEMKKVRPSDKEPPEECPYILEHLVQQC